MYNSPTRTYETQYGLDCLFAPEKQETVYPGYDQDHYMDADQQMAAKSVKEFSIFSDVGTTDQHAFPGTDSLKLANNKQATGVHVLSQNQESPSSRPKRSYALYSPIRKFQAENYKGISFHCSNQKINNLVESTSNGSDKK